MIYVCDAIMGAGKSSAAINYMNERPHQKFIYVTPFTDETIRIRDACPELHFWTPANLAEHEYKKKEHFKHLAGAGLNIATTHVLFSLCDDEAADLIREQEYTIIIDEAVAAMDVIPAKADDIKTAMSSDWFKCENSDDGMVHKITVSDKEYNGDWMRDIRMYAKSHRLVALTDRDGEDKLYCWMFNPDLFYMAKDTFILTYLFDASPMSYLFQMYDVEHEPVYVTLNKDGEYMFSADEEYMPEYTARLSELLHVLQNKKMNQIGHDKRALSITWSKDANKKTADGRAAELKRNLENYFQNIHRDSATSASDRLWTCHGALKSMLKGKGYTNRHLVFNSRATNEYKDAFILAYCANVFMPVWEQKYYLQEGVDVNTDLYALSTMIQWIWRSAIRDGKEVWIYVPSRRMRELLEGWIADVTAKGKAFYEKEEANTNNKSKEESKEPA